MTGTTADEPANNPWSGQKDLTPESLVRTFADFAYELGDRVQDSETFLKRKRGDCDDFSKLVSEVLAQHGYKTKLVVVMMEKETHVVCYVEERHGYLDYNLRAAAKPIVESDGSLEDIADKVAASFRSKWHMASEIRYQESKPVFVTSVFPPAKPKAVTVANATPKPATDKSSPALVSVENVTSQPAAEKPVPFEGGNKEQGGR